MTTNNNNTTHVVVCSNGYSNSAVFHGSYTDCCNWLNNNTVPVDFGSNTFNCVPDDNSPNGYDSNGDGYPNYYSVSPNV